jgi:hypothetical protein
MGYIGNQTSNSYSSLAKQTITGDGGTGYTLDHAVANAQEIEVFVNNVRQEPGVAYTVSGTALTMTGNVAASDDFYVVFQGKALQTTVPPDDSVTTARINDDAVTSDKLAHDINIVSSLGVNTIKENTGTTTAISIDSSGRVSTPQKPYFFVYHQTASGSTGLTGVVNFNNARHNVGSHFDLTNDYFQAPVDGCYLFCFQGFFCSSSGGSVGNAGQDLNIEKSTDSGSTWTNMAVAYTYDPDNNHDPACINIILLLDSGDRVRLKTASSKYVYADTLEKSCVFTGCLLG